VLIIISLLKAILLWRNHSLNAFGCQRFDQRIRVVAFVSDQCLRLKAFNQSSSLWAVVTLAGGQDEAQRIAQSINGDMNLRREAAATSA
jgi:hypothetical protein